MGQSRITTCGPSVDDELLFEMLLLSDVFRHGRRASLLNSGTDRLRRDRLLGYWK